MSPRSSSPRTPRGAPPDPDIFVGLLAVAALSLLAGGILFWMEMSSYQGLPPGM